ncbi:hypothetical protein [Sphingomonas faeni]|uniref:hypothetical protein n=1 Tax=Sphingomonas faeni TaxID=185950 RepID=UPI003349638A
MTQRNADGFVGQPANAAGIDHIFSRSDDVDTAPEWLQANHASGIDREAWEDAEDKWMTTTG